jgi:hypothetical protein
VVASPQVTALNLGNFNLPMPIASASALAAQTMPVSSAANSVLSTLKRPVP